MSGYPDDDVARRGLLDAGMSFLEQPISPEVLTGSCARCWKERHARPEHQPTPAKSVSALTPPLLCGLHIFRRPVGAEAETLRAGVAGGVSVHLELRPSLSAAALLKESMHG